METGPIVLTAEEARILGALIEKEITTPEYYPLSLNALMNAAIQRSNREPVMSLDEEQVRQALRGLEELGIAGAARADGRVAKYEHRVGEVFNFTRAETALICVLLLRGPQTPGELRGRTERLHSFGEISEVVAGLEKLIAREPSLAVLLPRLPGARESRYAQLLTGPVDVQSLAAPAARGAASTSVSDEKIAQLEAAIEELRAENKELRQQFAALTEKIKSLFG